MEHIDLVTDLSIEPHSSEDFIDLGYAQAHCCPMSTFDPWNIELLTNWIVIWTKRQVDNRPSGDEEGIIVLISNPRTPILEKVKLHYSEENFERWERLEQDLPWIYIDTYFLFTKWDRIWSAVKKNLRQRIGVSFPCNQGPVLFSHKI